MRVDYTNISGQTYELSGEASGIEDLLSFTDLDHTPVTKIVVHHADGKTQVYAPHAPAPEVIPVVIRPPKKGETYWSDADRKWIPAVCDFMTNRSYPVRVKS